MAKIYLDSGDNFTLSSAASVNGSTGTEKVVVNSGVTGVDINANVERVDLAGASSAYTYLQTGNALKVYSGTTLVATVYPQDDTDGTQLVFSNGSVSLKISTAGITLGGATVPSAAAAAVTPTTIDATVTSGSGSSTGSSNGTYTVTSDMDTVVEGKTATFTVTRSGDVTAAKTLTFNASGDTNNTTVAAAAAGVDASPASGTVTFEAGAKTATFTVSANADTAVEGLEGLRVRLFDGTTAVADKVVLINDDTTGTSVPGNTYTLTTSVDNVVGTSGNDTVIGVYDKTTGTNNTTYTASDNIDGGAGTDTLQVSIQGAEDISGVTLAAASVKNVEVASIRNVNGNATAAKNVLTVDANTFVGVTELVADRSTGGLKFNNVGKADVSVVGNSTATNAAVTIDVGATIVTDAFTLNFKDGTKGANSVNVADSEADWTEATINSTGAANATGTMNLSGTSAASTHTIKTLTINAATNLTIGADDTTVDITGFDTAAGVTNTIKVNGAAASVKINDVAATIDVIDASGLTAGGLTADLQDVTSTKLKVTGGAGNDAITTDALALSAVDGAFVDAAGGTADVLTVSGTKIDNDTAGKAVAALYKNFEVLGVTNSVIQDASIFTASTIGAVRIAGGTASTGFSNLSAAQAANVTLTAAGAGNIDIGVKNATVTGNIDTVKITVDDLVADNAKQPIETAAGKLTLTGVEKLEVTAIDNFTAKDLVGGANLDTVTLKGAGNYSITTGAVHWAINSTIDASAATGTVVINASGAQSASADKGLAIKGSLTNTNDIKDTAKADVITGGEKVDTITFLGGKDALTLGKGADLFNFNSKVGTANELTFKFVAGDSVGVAGATTVAAAFAGGKADTLGNTGTIKNDANAATAAGQKFTIDTDVTAVAVKTGTSIVFGTTAVDNAGDFFVLYGDAGAGDRTAYAFQDSNSNGKIDADDFQVKLVGANDFTADEFSIVGGNLVFTSVTG